MPLPSRLLVLAQVRAAPLPAILCIVVHGVAVDAVLGGALALQQLRSVHPQAAPHLAALAHTYLPECRDDPQGDERLIGGKDGRTKALSPVDGEPGAGDLDPCIHRGPHGRDLVGLDLGHEERGAVQAPLAQVSLEGIEDARVALDASKGRAGVGRSVLCQVVEPIPRARGMERDRSSLRGIIAPAGPGSRG